VRAKLFWCSRSYMDHNGCFIKDGMIVFQKDGQQEEIIPAVEVGLKGDHNMENILTSICAARLRGLELDVVKRIAREFQGVSDRQELVREVDEITYINDTTATQPDAVIAALKRFGADADVILIAGGMDKGAEYDKLANQIAETCKHLVLFEGDASKMISDKVGDRVKKTGKIMSMKDAVLHAKSLAASGDIILLSPAAASFNMFKNEFDRGEQFREEVRNL